MSLAQLLVAVLLASAALFSLLRIVRQQRRQPRPRPFFALLLLAQPLLAGLLYLGLYPPLQSVSNARMWVYTRAATFNSTAGIHIALPEAPTDLPAERMPDLATARRRYPSVHQLIVVGEGLESRDLATARQTSLVFQPTPLPAGLQELDAPSFVATGNAFSVQGRAYGVTNAKVLLRDPAGHVVQTAALDKDGHFTLTGQARSPGAAIFQLQLQAQDNTVIDAIPIALQVTTPPPLRLRILAGAPDPELKYLRRWAKDSGITLHTRIQLGNGMAAGDAPLPFTSEALAQWDALLLDTRSLMALSPAETQSLHTAILQGLGLLLRSEAALTTAERTRMAHLGFAAKAEQVNTPPLTAWQAVGRGRIGFIQQADSYTQVLAGQPSLHANLWSAAFAPLARATAAATADVPTRAWPNVRSEICGLGRPAQIVTPNGQHVPLAIDPDTGARHCAAFWPQQSGWHQLHNGTTTTPFFVLPENAGKSLRAYARQMATLQLSNSTPRPAGNVQQQRSSPWPWLAAWLLLTTLVWWVERRSRAN